MQQPDVTISDSTSLPVHERLRELAKRQQRQQRLLTVCVVGLLIVLLLNLIPSFGGVLAAISFSLGGIFIVLLLISITMGVLERYNTPGRNPPPGDDVARQV